MRQMFCDWSLEKWPFFLLSAVSCVVTFLAQRHGEAVVSLAKVSLRYRLENAPVAVRALSAENVLAGRSRRLLSDAGQNSRAGHRRRAVAVLIVISVAVWRARRRCPYLLVGWLWFLGTLVPVIGLVQVGGAALADRYTYIPSIGLFLAVAFGVRDLAARFQFPPIAVGRCRGLILARLPGAHGASIAFLA